MENFQPKPNETDDEDAQAASPASEAAPRPRLTVDELIERMIAFAKPNPLRLLSMLLWIVRGRQTLERELDMALRTAANDEAEQADVAAMVAPLVVRQGRRAVEPAHPGASATVTVLHSARTEHDADTPPPGPGRTDQYAHLVRALRPQQWAKNGLVFVPLLLAGRFADSGAIIDTILAFLALSMIASSTYLINDLWDIAEDRRHWSKCERPLASGALPVSLALAVAPMGIVLGLILGAMASLAVAGCLLAYVVVTVSYSLVLKRIAFVDGLVLASLFTLRIAIGMVAADVPPSPWLAAVSMFLFASLSFAKRYVEIVRVAARGGTVVNGRGYHVTDSPVVLAIGVASGLDAVAMMAVYVFYDAPAMAFYSSTPWLWAFPVLLFAFVSRVWLACVRDEADDDLVSFALADRQSLFLLALLVLAFLLAWKGPL